METNRHRVDRAEARVRQQEALRSLHAAVETLAMCVQRIEDLIHQVDGHLGHAGPPPVPHHRAEVSFGGGPSVIGAREPLVASRDPLAPPRDPLPAPRDPLPAPREPSPAVRDEPLSFSQGAVGSRDSSTRLGERRRGIERRALDEERRLVNEGRTPRQSERRAPGIPALMAATELAHLGYSRDEIADRLRQRWGDRAAAILREALD